MYLGAEMLQAVREKLKTHGVVIPGLDEQTPENWQELFKVIDKVAEARMNHFMREEVKLLDMEQSVKESWPRSLPLLEKFIGLASNISIEFYFAYRGGSDGPNSLFAVLHELHARACQVAGAILVLLKAGYADDAFARWRTLHEIVVVSSFILKYREQNAAAKYQEHGFSNPTNHKGWAAEILGKKSVGIAELEQETDLKEMRKSYRAANYNIHVDSYGSSIRRSLSRRQDMILAAGPSIFGLGIAGHSTAVSLNQVTVTMLRTELDSEFLPALGLLNVLEEKIYETFRQEHDSLEESQFDYPNPHNYSVYYI